MRGINLRFITVWFYSYSILQKKELNFCVLYSKVRLFNHLSHHHFRYFFEAFEVSFQVFHVPQQDDHKHQTLI